MDDIDQAQPDSVFLGKKMIRAFFQRGRFALRCVQTGQDDNADISSYGPDRRNQTEADYQGQRNIKKDDIGQLISQDVFRLVGIFSFGNIYKGFIRLDNRFQLAAEDW